MDGSDKKAFFILCIVNTVFDIPDCVVQYASAYAEDLHNYFHEFVDNALDCAKYAKTINGSLFWSWNHQNKACYPKTSNSDKKPARLVEQRLAQLSVGMDQVRIVKHLKWQYAVHIMHG